eukprot:TRINITY_DN2554_c0_g1_i1.p1 TRINITY_DN2554_c0_g1~~TRINITY_DN2554_c0_g1_i1.p1  ORF type:complete len:470 (-),score=127.15 TRINITY_DN2554_c0_g1_i1:122-1321(-)
MDTWNERQLKKMKAGSNGPFIEFFERYGMPMSTPIKQKYNSKVAEAYKEKIEAAADGKSWTAPASIPLDTPSVSAGLGSSGGRSSASSASSAKSNRPKADDDWDNWGDESPQVPAKDKRTSSLSSTHTNGSHSAPGSQRNSPKALTSSQGYGGATVESPGAGANRFQGQRAISSADYFGEDESHKIGGRGAENETLKTIEDNISKLSMGAIASAKIAADKLRQGTTQISSKVQSADWQETANNVSAKTYEVANKGWGLMQGYWSKAKEVYAQQMGEESPTGATGSHQEEYDHVDHKSNQDDFYSDSNERNNSIRGNQREEEEHLEDWLNDDAPKARSGSTSGAQATARKPKSASNDWDDWGDETSPKSERNSEKSGKSGKSGKSAKPAAEVADDDWDKW